MARDLETLRTEILAYFEQSGITVFYGYHRVADSLIQVYWDTERHPDFREFLETGRKSGAKLVVFNHQAFSLDQIEEALEQLEDCDFTREEKRTYEKRLRQLQAYEGFTCSIELSFAMEGRIYLYELHTEWYQALNDILAELDVLRDDSDEDGSIGGYYSKN